MDSNFRFTPLHFNWVAIHPNPVGVVYFIGGFFFGTFPTIFYRAFLKGLYNEGYTVVAMPFRLSFRHWLVAISMAKDLIGLRKAIAVEADHLGYDSGIYTEDPTATGRHYWISHSLGCKYVALLEILSDLEGGTLREVLSGCVGGDQYRQIVFALKNVDLHAISLKNQPSILMAPVISGLEAAVPIGFIARALKRIGIDVSPNVEETHCLIKRSPLFNCTSVIAFSDDRVEQKAGTIDWLRDKMTEVYLPNVKISELFRRRHLAPLGYSQGDDLLLQLVSSDLLH